MVEFQSGHMTACWHSTWAVFRSFCRRMWRCRLCHKLRLGNFSHAHSLIFAHAVWRYTVHCSHPYSQNKIQMKNSTFTYIYTQWLIICGKPVSCAAAELIYSTFHHRKAFMSLYLLLTTIRFYTWIWSVQLYMSAESASERSEWEFVVEGEG